MKGKIVSFLSGVLVYAMLMGLPITALAANGTIRIEASPISILVNTWWKSFSMDEIQSGAEQIAAEAQSLNPGYKVTMYFSYGSYSLGMAYAFGTYEQSNFKVASIWIK